MFFAILCRMNKLLAVLGSIAGIALTIASFVYFITPAKTLPDFMPGHNVTVERVHYEHGVAALLLAVAAFVFASFQSGTKSEH